MKRGSISRAFAQIEGLSPDRGKSAIQATGHCNVARLAIVYD
jgi:hypothetical protein